MGEGVTNHVPQAAIDAAIRVINLDEMGGAFDNQEDYARQILEAAAPHIASQVLLNTATKMGNKSCCDECGDGARWLIEQAVRELLP